MTEYFEDLHGLQGDKKTAAAEVRKRVIDKWLDIEEKLTGIETWSLDAATFVIALKRLKAGKNSPDGLTAEVLRSFPLELRAQLSTDIRRRLHELDMPREMV